MLGLQAIDERISRDGLEGPAHFEDIVGRVWMWIIAGIAAGAVIHGYVPAELMTRIDGLPEGMYSQDEASEAFRTI